MTELMTLAIAGLLFGAGLLVMYWLRQRGKL